MNETPSLLKNQGARQNFFSIRLTGAKSNRSAIGSRVIVEAGGRRQIDEVMSGGSYYSQNEMSLYFGLGRAEQIDRLEIRWPSGAVQIFKQVPINRAMTITEGGALFEKHSRP